MDINKQSQSSGDNSQLIQAQTVIFQGITEQRAREICREEYLMSAQTRVEEARAIADERVSKLEDKVIPKMIEYDNSLKSFSDPTFLFSLKQAQASAASTDKEEDYDLLAELLLNRVKDGADRGKRLAINTAIGVVDKIPEEALVGLGMVYTVMHLFPLAEQFNTKLEGFNRLYGKIIGDSKLPTGTDWLEHLDLLSIIRLSPHGIGSFNKMENVIPDYFENCRVTGLAVEDPILSQIKEDFQRAGLPLNAFVEHPIRPGFEILDLPRNVDEIKLFYRTGVGVKKIEPTLEQKALFRRALDLINVNAFNDQNLKDTIMQKWNKYPALNQVLKWWNNITLYFTITPAGMALANAFAHGRDATVPKIE